ncbi:MAG TPA: STAS/SEC14 domain-containing protein [Chloroflexota bacterium]|jgi:hypothetical protein|nr:STAS/SEC14 domain-containing protein [Chloroflexota bacterium]
MTTIPIEAQVSTDQLLHAVEQLPPQEFAAFVDQILALRAQRRAPHLSEQETALLLQINQGLDATIQRRFEELMAKRHDERISPAELDELVGITDLVEQLDAQRLAALTALAGLRHMSLASLMTALGIQLPPDA